MAENKIKIRRSSVPGKVPISLLEGELAVNTADKKLYFGTGTSVLELTSRERYNVPVTTQANGGSIDVISSLDFVLGSTRLYLGGQRLALGVDYTEVSNNTLSLTASLSVAEVASGSTITLDLQEN